MNPQQLDELAEIRQALSDAVDRGSLRGVAREIGMSPTGLRGLMDGAEPYGKSLRKVRAWFVVDQAQSDGDLPATTVASLLRTLLRRVPARERRPACASALDHIAELHERAGVAVPAWVAGAQALVAGQTADDGGDAGLAG